MAPAQKIVAVLGATGQQVCFTAATKTTTRKSTIYSKKSTNESSQGGSIVREFLKDGEKYHVRGLTRNNDSPKSKALAQQGVEMVKADLDDAASLQRAFDGAHIIYAMTDFWQTMSAEIETEQGKRIVDVAEKLPQLEHFVWASLPDGRALSQGQFSNIFHWQSKADVAKYMRDSKPVLWSKTIEILFPNYMENCVTNAPVYLPVKVRGFMSGGVPLRRISAS